MGLITRKAEIMEFLLATARDLKQYKGMKIYVIMSGWM